MTALKTLLTASLILLTSTAKSFANDGANDGQIAAQLETLAQDFPGLSVTVRQKGKTVLQNTYGVANLESGEPVTGKTRFNIYSVSKLVTGMAFLRLVHEDRVSLDAPVTKTTPNLPDAYGDITLRQLLTHSSGIRHYRGREDWIAFARRSCSTPMDAIGYFAQDTLSFAPGTQKLYSTFGMVVASQVLLDLHHGKTFDAALSGLLGDDYKLTLDHLDAEKAMPYIQQGDGYLPIAPISAECKFGGGGLLASSQDLAVFGEHIASGAIVPVAVMRRLLETGRVSFDERYAYGMGFGVTPSAAGEDVLYVTAGGGAAGGRGYLLVLIEPQIAIAITGNTEGDGEAVAQAALALARHFLNGP